MQYMQPDQHTMPESFNTYFRSVCLKPHNAANMPSISFPFSSSSFMTSKHDSSSFAFFNCHALPVWIPKPPHAYHGWRACKSACVILVRDGNVACAGYMRFHADAKRQSPWCQTSCQPMVLKPPKSSAHYVSLLVRAMQQILNKQHRDH